MKYCAVLCLALMSGTIVLAQQPANWKPSIANDNKAASYKDTEVFLVNFIESTAAAHFGEAVLLKTDAKAEVNSDGSPSCRIQLRQTYWRAVQFGDDRPGLLFQMEGILDLRSVDPLSIVLGVPPEDPRYPRTYSVYLEGKDRTSVGIASITGLNKVKPPIGKDISSSLLCDASNPLISRGSNGEPQKGSYCRKEDNPWPYSYRLFLSFEDQESSRRIAQALMHEALLCGGTKAISPF
jgi:hypothetical protein